MMLATHVGIFLTITSLCTGLRCWHCENEKNNWDCMLNGELQQCLPSQMECQNEIRSIANDRYFKITKRCKQDIGCGNNRKQNELITNSYQCEKRDTVDVCWCCCTGDNCNGPEVFCQKMNPKCEPLVAPPNGIVTCQRNDNSLGTNCVYRCLPGFNMVGTARITCVRTRFTATWSASRPTCDPIVCESLPEEPTHGSVFCSEGNSVYSSCGFTCDRDYILIGARTTVCSHLGVWSEPVPECAQVTCRFPATVDNNIEMDCSNSNNLGSYCRFTCPVEFDIRGSEEITCAEPIKSRFGQWTDDFPSCIRISCKRPTESTTMNVDCTSSSDVGSICTYSCKEGNYMTSNQDPANVIMSGVALITCSVEVGWTQPPPICQPIVCPRLARTFKNGSRSCTQGGKFGSECFYTCDSGYVLTASDSITCDKSPITSKGEWSDTEPQCVPRYQCTIPSNSEAAIRECTDGNNEGSICTYSCGEGEFMTSPEDASIVESGTVSLTCLRDIGWTGKPPVCRPIICPVLLTSFENGKRACSKDVRYGSKCTYACNPTYQLTDNRSITCMQGSIPGQGAWSDDEPRCVGGVEFGAGTCLNYGSVPNGEVKCKPVRSTNGTHWLEGSECQVFCSGQFATPIGEFSSIRCSRGRWLGRLCCDACLSTQRLDIFVLIDVSGADNELREVYRSFVEDFALYLTETYRIELNFSIVPYSTSVDSSNIIKASKINFDNYETIKELLETIPVSGGGDSNTGKALQFVNDISLNALAAGSVPLIVILTNKKPNDNDLALREAKRLRDQRVHIRVVPLTDFFNARPGRNKADFEAITGGEAHSVIDSDSVESFYEVVSEGINRYDWYCDSRAPAC